MAKNNKEILPETPAVSENGKISIHAMENPEKVITRAERIAREKARCEELVTAKLTKTGDKHKDSLYVAVGGKNILVRAGAQVRIPRKFALVIEESIRQQELTMELIEQATEKG